jgi:predicted metal-dependent hydrolase
MNFSFWLFLENSQKYVRSRRETSPKNPDNSFLVLYGADPEERELMFGQKDRLKRLGFRYFGPNQTYSLFSTKITPQIRAELEGMGVDLGGYDAPPQQTAEPQAPAEPSKADETLERMHGELEKAKNDSDKKAKALIESIEKMIEEVANGTDEAAKQAFIRNFLDFAGRFYNYSFHNQMLIWIQTKGQARHVASAKKWEEFGRTVKDWGRSIDILAPRTPKKTKEDPAKESETRAPVYFVPVKVYDISATAPIPGHPKSFEPISRKDWSKDSNEDLEDIKGLVDALDAWVKEQGIEVKPEDMDAEQGGYSAGGRIAINNTFKGINMFSTYVHEVAHELLHWKDAEGKRSTRQEKEIDAETTAYIVLRHFGLETKDTSNYLALWQAKGDDVRARRKNIHKAAMEIINGIKGKVEPGEEASETA